MKRRELPLAVSLTSKRVYKDTIGKPLARVRINLSSTVDQILDRQREDKICTSDASKAYAAARQRIGLANCVRDEQGHPVSDGAGGVQLRDPYKFREELEVYDRENPDQKQAYDQDQDALSAWLDEEVEFHRYKGVEADLPSEATASEYWALFMLLDFPADS